MAFVLFYCILFCQVWLLSLDREGELTSRGEGRCGRAWRKEELVKMYKYLFLNFCKRINKCEKLVDVNYSQFNLNMNAARIKIPV